MARKTLGEEIGKRNPFECPEEELWLNLAKTFFQQESSFFPLFREHDLTPSQYNVLRILRGAGETLSCQEIGSRMISGVPDITRLVDRLEAAGLVERSRTAEDRRVVLTRITPLGLERIAPLDEPLRALHRSLFGHLTAREIATLNRLLVKARTSAIDERPEAAGPGCSRLG